MRPHMIKPLLLAVLVVFASLANADGQHAPYRRIVVFGDSLSDPGNAYALLHQVQTPPFPLIPEAPYARGGFHFSNGKTWVEQFADARGLGASVGPAYALPHVFSNYAVGGARARSGALFDLATQVGSFLGDFNGTAPDDALYVFCIGSNDVRDATAALASDASGATSAAILGAAVGAIRDNMLTLASAGARHFLIANAPDLALVPAVSIQGPSVQGAARALAVNFNDGLAATVGALTAGLPIDVAQLDVYSILDQVVAQPQAFGLSDVVDTCIVPGVTHHAYCAHPNRYLFWDGVHPTRAGHAVLAGDAARLLPVQYRAERDGARE